MNRVFRRPMPVQEFAVGRLPEPVPLHCFPQRRDRVADVALGGSVTIEVLPRRQQSLHQERRLHEVRAVVVGAEIRDRLAGPAVQIVWPNAVEAIGLLQESEDLLQSLNALRARDELPLDAGNQRHDAEARRSERHEVVVAGRDLDRHAGIGMRAVPVVAEARLLHHRQQLLVRHLDCRSGDDS